MIYGPEKHLMMFFHQKNEVDWQICYKIMLDTELIGKTITDASKKLGNDGLIFFKAHILNLTIGSFCSQFKSVGMLFVNVWLNKFQIRTRFR